VSDEAQAFRSPIGTHDVLPPASYEWEGIIAIYAQICHLYGFGLVISPMFEDVAVFQRGIGEESEVTKKEMYVFRDRGDRQMALRPEGTASVVRAFVQHHPKTPWKVWYCTPAFRYERPQAGRFRQHHQLGVEVLGTDDPGVDVEVISLAWRFYEALGLRRVRLLVNSMGHAQCRDAYVETLRMYLHEHELSLCDEHRKLWSSNPLRVLDCKEPQCVKVTSDGPLLINHICDECRHHFDRVTSGLTSLGIAWELSPRLVRGFDYYNRTTFEFASEALDVAQNAIGGGGRYDRLAEELGGEPASGIGFGSGVERILLARDKEGVGGTLFDRSMEVFVVDTTGGDYATLIVDELRRHGIAADRAYDDRSMKAQMKNADRSGARLALLVGSQEAASGTVTIRDLRNADTEQRQREYPLAELLSAVRTSLTESI